MAAGNPKAVHPRNNLAAGIGPGSCADAEIDVRSCQLNRSKRPQKRLESRKKHEYAALAKLRCFSWGMIQKQVTV